MALNAELADSELLKLTNPKPLDLPDSLSVMTFAAQIKSCHALEMPLKEMSGRYLCSNFHCLQDNA